ncbi:uncharacterized protein BN781_01053 [Coprococcus sp. CAG:782]|nr:uncharacterized protein BN781_01053 [Coprococcus sp. CAG:782]
MQKKLRAVYFNLKIMTAGLFISCCFLLCGCNVYTMSDKGNDVSYDICEEGLMPDELKNIVDDKREQEFKITYTNNDYTYIVIGAGRRDHDNIRIDVDKVYKDENAIYIKSVLRSIATATDSGTMTCPVVVVRIERTMLPVVFR